MAAVGDGRYLHGNRQHGCEDRSNRWLVAPFFLPAILSPAHAAAVAYPGGSDRVTPSGPRELSAIEHVGFGSIADVDPSLEISNEGPV